ncbi:hypothetical protein RE438_19125 [Bacillus wiedmannii]|uniref:hypothetical protein n=1 Tax=Bacillus wiedmannii TaxID=1890302 RepID=UPI00065BC35F|nr:hypothetical protein [Bacillus wiedmannii]KMP71228.1 hypothetical protein TU62_28925 [Bacillus cereus]MCQ6544053.1 hypothetical protein [Bacillus wiedmannii]MCQ6573645.1 hypothetical protein [Bacillus wiedmannii]MCU5577363.1 hypothetical protein [Bacillus wiedmannii]WMS80569.1 hypothetical protein RE438_19125 [Bacillus wiedmannii]
MSEKVYSIASPSICTKEKSHVVTIGSGPNRNQRTYSFSITPANTENKNDVEYPICIAPYARHKAVREDNAIVTATKVRAKGILSSAIEEAIRQNEIDASISDTTDFELNRIIDVANLETQHSQRIDSVPVQLISTDESIQHERIFNIDHIEGVESERPNERTAVVHQTDESQLITREYEAAQIIEQDIFKNKLREFVTAGVDELPEWVKVARVLYGEEFYQDVSSIVTREIQGEYNEGAVSNIVSPTIDALINTEVCGDTKRKEIETRLPDDYAIFTTEHELQASLEEFDLFDGRGTPVYLPDYDLFARIQRELVTNIEIQHDFERKTIIENADLLPSDDLTTAEREPVIDATRIDFDSSIRMKELNADSIMIEDSNKHMDVFATESSEPYTFERINDQYADIVQIHNSELIVKELESILPDTQVSVKKENVFTAEVANSQESEITSRILSVEDITASTTALKIQNTFEVIESSKEEFIRLTELTANIAHIDGADRLLNDSKADAIELISADKEDSPVLIDVSEIISSELKAQDILTTLEDHDVIANKTIKELPASIEEFDLFEGMGIPVYLPEFDLFGRIHKELETRITIFENTSKISKIIQMQIDQTIESKKVMQEHTTTVIEEVASYKQNTQQALITEQETFIGIREFEGGVIPDITPADKEVITTDTEVIETVDAARESEQYAIVSEQELLERQDSVDAATNEVDTFDREHELEIVTEEYERFERTPERESVLEDNELFKMERVLDTEKPDELIVIEKENDDPKLWLRHSRQSWWTNSNWKKTR